MLETGIYPKLRAKVMRQLDRLPALEHPWADVLMAGPDLIYLLSKLVTDKRVPLKQKAKLAAALGYFLSPIEILPEIILGPIGLIDDIAFAAFALHSVINEIDPQIVRDHWMGKEEALDVIQRVLNRVTSALGSGVWGKVSRRFRRAS